MLPCFTITGFNVSSSSQCVETSHFNFSVFLALIYLNVVGTNLLNVY